METAVHKYATCFWVSPAWNKLLDIILNLEPSMVFESANDILKLNFTRKTRENAILWLISRYLSLVEIESVTKNCKINEKHLISFLSAKILENKFSAMPDIGAIPDLDRSGVG